MSGFIRKKSEKLYTKRKENRNYGPAELDIDTIRRINRRIEQASLDYDIPYPSGGELRDWQKALMKRN